MTLASSGMFSLPSTTHRSPHKTRPAHSMLRPQALATANRVLNEKKLNKNIVIAAMQTDT
jgi:hypothetical protein